MEEQPIFEDKNVRLYHNRFDYNNQVFFGRRWETRYLKDVQGSRRCGSSVLLVMPLATAYTLHLRNAKVAQAFLDAMNQLM